MRQRALIVAAWAALLVILVVELQRDPSLILFCMAVGFVGAVGIVWYRHRA